MLTAGGSDQGAVIVPHDLEASRLWKQVQSDEMPPESPLSVAQKALLQRWIQSGAPGLSPTVAGKSPDQHWSFRPFDSPKVPMVIDPKETRNSYEPRVPVERANWGQRIESTGPNCK